MLKNILKFSTQQLNKEQQQTIQGGRIPTLEEFCCGSRPQSWWIEQYPFLAGTDCSSVNCSIAGPC